jgi:hypothetical protein
MLKTNKSIPWSYSSITLFQQCPKKYYHLRVAKDIVEPETEVLLYGTRVHEAAEKFVRDGEDLPPEFSQFHPPLEKLRGMPGEKYCEHKMGITERGEPCEFFSPQVWLRGVADLIVVDGDKARIIDYKTGKSAKYADTKQLDLMALCTFAHFPQVNEIKGGLLFLVCHDLVKRSYTRDDVLGIMRDWTANYSWLSKTYKENVWNPRPNFSCRSYCPVLTCLHNGRNV